MKKTRRCCYCAKIIKGRGKDAPTPWGAYYPDMQGEYRCCEECYLKESGWGDWYAHHEC